MLNNLKYLALMALMAAPHHASAQADEDQVLLRIIGLAEHIAPEAPREGDDIILTRADLTAIEATSFETETIWTEGPQTFTGVEMEDLLAWLDIPAQEVTATATNDYAITIPAEDMVDGGAMIAYERNGRAMGRRDKGPLWVVYPFDDNADYRTELIYSRAIWQLTSLDFSGE